jgi:hypothetical protein
MLSSWQKSEDNNGGDSFLDGGVGRLPCFVAFNQSKMVGSCNHAFCANPCLLLPSYAGLQDLTHFFAFFQVEVT